MSQERRASVAVLVLAVSVCCAAVCAWMLL